MKKFTLFFMAFFFALVASAQDKKHTYLQFDAGILLKGNQDRGDETYNTDDNDSWFLPDGLSAKLGYGIHHKKWIALGIHTGIDWKGSEKLVVVPVFANIKFNPKISEDTSLYLQAGYGKSFAIGRGNLSGDYKKASLGIETSDGISLFIELSQYGLNVHNLDKINSLSIGISLTTY